MEKCGKLWRPECPAADWHEAPGPVCSISGAGGANEIRACSACAGDYEDPDRTAWSPDDAEDEQCEEAQRTTTEEFPAEE